MGTAEVRDSIADRARMVTMDADYERYHYSATFQTNDEAVLHCLRALCQWAQRDERSPNIGWGGTGERPWQDHQNVASVRFTSTERRQKWIAKATELLGAKWTLVKNE
jgi:hypothetical protein